MKNLVLLILLCLSLPFHADAASRRLNLFIWSEYIDPEVVSEFEKKFDCKVTIDLYEDDAAMMSKLQAGGDALYDVVVPPDHKVPALIKLGLLAPLRPEKLPNLQNLDERFKNPPFDPGNRYTVSYQWGTMGIYLRTGPGKAPEPTWGLLFDARLQPGAFVLIDNARDMVGAALKHLGHSLNSTAPEELKAARDLVVEAKKRCAGFDGSVGAKNKVLGKVAKAGIVYSGEAARGMSDDKETTYLIPREGSQIWQDNLAILSKAPNREAAELFVNYILDAEIGARISNFTRFATPNRAARAHIRPEDLANPAIYPPEETMKRLEMLKDLGAKTRFYDEIWTQIKAR
jgi:spermidine/putrescine transport system substrate-binding protein